MSKDNSSRRPIEISFPIEEVNEIASKEGHAKRYYRPVYTMHKYWARRLGSVFRTMLLYSLAEDEIHIKENGQESLEELPDVDWDNPEALWEYYLEDVDFDGKTVLDPFMGGGTTIVEALRMGCNVIGSDLNPVAWFTVKKEIEPVDIDDLQEAYDEIYESIGEEILEYYQTPCPDCDGMADAMYYFWVKEIECLNCGHDVPLFKGYYFADSRSSNDSYKNVLCPDCWTVQQTDDHSTETKCVNDDCGNKFMPKEGTASGENYTCPDCGVRSKIIDATKRFGKPDSQMYAVEYYCDSCDEKGYKDPTDHDLELYEKASQELEEEWDELPIPEQDRYQGSSDRAWNHGYHKYHQMFNDRQLLLLGRLLHEIDDIEDQNVKEFLLTTFSAMLESNNMFCMYNRVANKLEPIYNYNTIIARHTPVEGNIWGSDYGRGTFKGMFDKTKAAKEWCQSPVEKYIDEDGNSQDKQMQTPVEGVLVDDASELGETGNAMLRCGTSEYLPIEDESVDAIITDPPYYDNEMYAELSDFYYVWLHQVLSDTYDHFQGERTPKKSEAVVDPAKDVEDKRTEEHYIETLTNVFNESRRKLADDGIMAFTFHHKETEAWGSTLQSVLDADFYISALYPVNSETRGGTRHGRATVDYDTIIVCRKRQEDPEEVSWKSLEDDIYFRAEDEIDRLEQAGRRLTGGDIFVVAMGKCLEIFSKHYPNVTRDGEQMDVVEAVDAIKEIVDEQLLEERFQILSEEMDPLSAVYLTHVLGRGEELSFNALNKDLRQRGVDVAELVHEDLLEQQGDDLVILDPLERADRLENKNEPLAIDKAHYLYYLFETDQLAKKFGQWTDEAAINALRRLSEIEGDDDYDDIAEYVKEQSDTQLEIEDFS